MVETTAPFVYIPSNGEDLAFEKNLLESIRDLFFRSTRTTSPSYPARSLAFDLRPNILAGLSWAAGSSLQLCEGRDRWRLHPRNRSTWLIGGAAFLPETSGEVPSTLSTPVSSGPCLTTVSDGG